MGAGGGLGECVEKRGCFPGRSAFRRRPGREGERCTLGQMLCGVGVGVGAWSSGPGSPPPFGAGGKSLHLQEV